MASQIACQLYTLREYTKTPSDIAKTFARVKKIGYDAVQCSALGKIDPKELASILKNEGLTCCVTHSSLESLRDTPQEVIENHRLWNCAYTALGAFNPKEPSAREWHEFAAAFSRIASRYRGSGLSIGYHNHSHELVKFDGRAALEILVQELSTDVWFEIDTYWITHGGGDPSAWIERVKGRIPCVHFKDFGITAAKQQVMLEVGAGNLNWPGIIDACRRAGVQWYIIEQDNCNGLDPFDCIERSLKNLKSLGVN